MGKNINPNHNKIVGDYRNKVPVSIIAKKYKISESSVYRIANKGLLGSKHFKNRKVKK